MSTTWYTDPGTGQQIPEPDFPGNWREKMTSEERIALAVNEDRAKKVAEVRQRLAVLSLDETMAQVAAEGPRAWLLPGIWISRTGCVLGGTAKVGKTNLLIDLAVSVASGTPWLNVFPVEETGMVICFFAEDDAFEVTRRLRAICADRKLDPAGLSIRLSFMPPNLSSDIALEALAEELAEHPAVLVLLDPLYLAIGEKGDGSNLYGMGAVLQAFGSVCRKASAALGIAHHWNKTGRGTGTSRFSGTGTVEFARTLLSVSDQSSFVAVVEHELEGGRTVTQQRKTTVLSIEVSGNSVPDQTVCVQRTMWAEDPDDLDSPLHYHCERVETVATEDVPVDPAVALRAVTRVYRAVNVLGAWVSSYEAQQWDALNPPTKRDGSLAKPMMEDTAYRALGTLAGEGKLLSRKASGKVVFALPGTPEDAVRDETSL